MFPEPKNVLFATFRSPAPLLMSATPRYEMTELGGGAIFAWKVLAATDSCADPSLSIAPPEPGPKRALKPVAEFPKKYELVTLVAPVKLPKVPVFPRL